VKSPDISTNLKNPDISKNLKNLSRQKFWGRKKDVWGKEAVW
jgi:hypothetical protein